MKPGASDYVPNPKVIASALADTADLADSQM